MINNAISNLVSGISVLLQPMMCGLNEVQGFPGHDGNMAGFGHEDFVEEVSLSHCEHLKNRIQSVSTVQCYRLLGLMIASIRMILCR